MRVSLNWLREFVDIDGDVEKLADELTMLGLEIEAIEQVGAELSDIVVGQIMSIDPHPDADKLVVCTTDIGKGEPLQIVCGAKNMSVGDRVPTAIEGSTLAGGFKIKRRKMRGVESQGMLCAPDELGIGTDHSGLLVLPPESPVGEDAIALLGLRDIALELEVTPNRGDWAGMIGVARELAALHRADMRLPHVDCHEGSQPASEFSSVTIEDPDLCPRYAGRVIMGVTPGPSPLWLCQRLLAAGLRPINNIVDVTNFVLLETGHPLHAFDYDTLTENRIVVRRAKQGETIETIDEQTRQLTPDMLIIADALKPVAIAGVMGGAETEVGEMSRNIFLESAYFHPPSVRSTARALGMSTEASQRFQRGADPEMAVWALDRAAALIQTVAGGTVAKGRLDEYPSPLERPTVSLRYQRSQLLLGTDVPTETQKEILERLSFDVIACDSDSCNVHVPSWRHDVSCEADLIEEIARVYGYQNIPVALPAVRQTDLIFAPEERPIRLIRNLLFQKGLTEVMSMTFSCERDAVHARLPDKLRHLVFLQNPLSENYAGMRTSLIPNMLAILSNNIRKGSRNLALFEVGPVYTPDESHELPNQRTACTIALSGALGGKHWSAPARPVDFYDIKGYAEALFEHIGIPWTLEAEDLPAYHPRASARVTTDSTALGTMGECHPKVMEAFDIDQPVFLLDLDLTFLLDVTVPKPVFSQPPTLPPSLRDLAVVVDSTVPAGQLVETVLTAGGKLLSQVHVFDVYTGKQVPQGKKSIALSLVFQARDKTLTDKDTDKSIDRIVAALREAHGAQLR